MKPYFTDIKKFNPVQLSGSRIRNSVMKVFSHTRPACYIKAMLILVLFTCMQDLKSQANYKMTNNKWATELNFNLFQEDLKLNNAIDQLKIRYSITPDLTTRFSLSLGNRKSSDKQVTDPSVQSLNKSTSNIGINLGLEKHFEGTGRLSPYIGSELSFGAKRSEFVLENQNTKMTVTGAWNNISLYNESLLTIDWQQRGYSSVGMNFLAGFDFFISRNIFCGYEIVYALNYIKYSPIITEYVNKIGTGPTPSSPRITGNTFEIGPKLLNGIRLGFVF